MSNMVIIAAPSAAGKTTLIKRYLDSDKNAMFAVSHTTREKRKDEVEGKDYHFVSEEEFKMMILNEDFIEWALVHDKHYGTSYSELDKAIKKDALLVLDIDVQGALLLKGQSIDAKYIFIMPPSIEELKNRLLERKTETEEQLKKRIWNAKREIEYADKFDLIIVNNDLDEAYNELKKYIDSIKTGV